MANVGYATLSVIPSLKGAQAALTGQMAGPASVAGTQAGGLFGGAFSGILAGGALVVGLGAGLAAVGSTFDEAYDHIRTETGATGAELEGLKDVFRGVVADVPTDFGSAADAIAGLEQRLHLTGAPLEGLSEQVLELSRVTETDLGGNVDSITRAFGDWGVATRDQQSTLDEFFRASQLGGISVSDLADNVTNFGSPLRQLGFGLEDSLAMFARFDAEGVNTSTVMSGMRQAVKNLGSGFAEQETGVSSFGDIIAGVKDGTFDLSDAMTVFGARAGTDMFKAIQEGRFDLADFQDQITHGEDTIRGAAADTNDWRESLEILKNRGLLLLEPIATRVFDALGNGAKFVMRLTQVFDRRGLAGALQFAANKFDELSTPIKVVVGALLALISPWALVAAGAVYAYTHFEGFRNVVDSVAQWLIGTAWPAIQTFASGLVDAFGQAVAWVQQRWPAVAEAVRHVVTVLGVIFRGASALITGIWRAIGDDVLSVARAAWGVISGVIGGTVKAIAGVINTVLGIINGDWSRVWNGIKQVASGVWNAILATVKGAWGVLKAVFGAGLSLLKSLWRTAWSGIRALLSAAWSAIKSAVRAGITAVIGFVRDLPGRAVNALSRLPGLLMNLGRAALRAMREGISAAWDGVKTFFASIPRRVITAIGDLGSVLLQAGKDLVQGLIDGIQSKAASLASVVDDLTTGLNPFDESTRLGRRLTAGVNVPVNLTPTIAPITPIDADLEVGRNGALSHRVVSSQSHATTVRLVVDGADQDMKRMLQKMIRVEGGDVQAVLGA